MIIKIHFIVIRNKLLSPFNKSERESLKEYEFFYKTFWVWVSSCKRTSLVLLLDILSMGKFFYRTSGLRVRFSLDILSVGKIFYMTSWVWVKTWKFKRARVLLHNILSVGKFFYRTSGVWVRTLTGHLECG